MAVAVIAWVAVKKQLAVERRVIVGRERKKKKRHSHDPPPLFFCPLPSAAAAVGFSSSGGGGGKKGAFFCCVGSERHMPHSCYFPGRQIRICHTKGGKRLVARGRQILWSTKTFLVDYFAIL